MDRFNNEDVVKEVKRRLSIIDLVQSYTSIQKKGKSYLGICPFHDDSNPSMNVDEEKGLFHCFSCGAGGDLIGFYMRYNHLSFPEALSELAKKANVEIKTRRSPIRNFKSVISQNSRLYKVNSIASKFYQDVLLNSPEAKLARGYLEKRNIRSEIIKEFALGYAPKGWDGLANLFVKRKVPLDVAERTGLIVKRNNAEGYYDRFRNRIMFPIMDVDQRVIGFGGRVLDQGADGNVSKYINSPESEIYHKRSNFYGLNKSKDYIRKQREAIVVEGYTDFLSLYSRGIKHVVATLGTALTGEHVSILKRYADKVILVFDGDSSGTKAAVRSLELFLEREVTPYIALIPDGGDPDSFISSQGEEEFQHLIRNSTNLINFVVDATARKFASGGITLRQSVMEVTALLAKLKNPVERSASVKRIAERLGVRESGILSMVKADRSRGSIYGGARAGGETGKRASAANDREMLVLKLLLHFPHLSALVNKEDWRDFISSREIKSILEEFIENGLSDASSLLARFNNSSSQEIISEALMSPSLGVFDKETAYKMLLGCINKLKSSRTQEKLKVLRLEMQEAVKNKDFSSQKRLLIEYSNMIKLNNRGYGEPDGQ